MKVPLEISYRGVDKTDAIEALVHEKVAKLEKVCNYISSCHIAIEKIHDRPSHGSPYRVRLDITVPPGHELVADSNPSEQNQYVELDTVIRDAFSMAERQVKELSRRQRESDKAQTNDSAQDTMALVTKLFPDQDYGFLKTLDGQDVYFHRNSVLHGDFDRLEIGTDFGLKEIVGSCPTPRGWNKSKISNRKSPSPVPLWAGSIQNRKSNIQNRLT